MLFILFIGLAICDLANEKGPQGGNGVISCTVLPKDVDFNKKRSSRSDKKCQSCEVSKFPKFCQKFYPIFRVLQFVGVKIMGKKKKFSNKKKFLEKNFFKDFFYFSKISLGIIFIFHSLYPYKFHLH